MNPPAPPPARDAHGRPLASASDDLPELDRRELARYARHLVLPEVGEEGQRRLKAARVLLVGAGGLGSPAALYLAAAGVGVLGLVDHDVVDATNLQRQILHGTSDVGRSKLASAVERLRDVNPHVVVEPHETRLTSENALEVLEPYDLVLDGTDNFPTRYLVNDACVLLGKPNVYASIHRWEGQLSLFAAPGGPCYRCLFREPPPPGLVPNCAEGGVFGVLPGILGSLQATEAVKWILGVGDPMVGRILIVDTLDMTFREVEVRRNPDCPVCGDEPTQTGLIDYEVFCGTEAADEGGGAAVASAGEVQPARGAPGDAGAPAADGAPPFAFAGGVPLSAAGIPELGARDLAALLEGDPAPLLLDVREEWEWRLDNLADRGAVHVPLRDLPDRLHEIPADRPVVAVCRSGARSAEATRFMRARGRSDVANLRGGLVAWAAQVDPDLTVA